MKTITIIRHGQSTFNVNNTPNTDNIVTNDIIIDARLTKLGCEQSAELSFNFDILILSPLKRSIETYINANITANELIVSKLFAERDYSYETENILKARAEQAADFLKLYALPGKHIGIISHKHFINYFLAHFGFLQNDFDNTQSFTFNL